MANLNPINNKRRSETKPLAISEYEHLETLVETKERVGEVPCKRNKAVEQADLTVITPAPKVWRTRRRRDGEVLDIAAPSQSTGARNLTPVTDFSCCGIS